MYKFNGTLRDDMKGSLTSKVPTPDYVGDVICDMLNVAEKLEVIYNLCMTEYSGENDFYSLLSDISDAIDDIDIDQIIFIRDAFSFGVIYSACERWIISPLQDLYYEDSKSEIVRDDSIMKILTDVIEDCDYVEIDKMQAIASALYNSIAAIYFEVYNTYGAGRWVENKLNGTNFINDITRGYNEVLIRMNKSPEEMSEYLFDKVQKFVFVTNEVDRDADVSKKVRSLVPEHLKEDFEGVIELITKEQVEDIVNGRIKITARFIAKLNEEIEDSSDDDGEMELTSDNDE